MSFSGVLQLPCSLWRITYTSPCPVALLKLLLSGQMCLPGYSINICFCELRAHTGMNTFMLHWLMQLPGLEFLPGRTVLLNWQIWMQIRVDTLPLLITALPQSHQNDHVVYIPFPRMRWSRVKVNIHTKKQNIMHSVNIWFWSSVSTYYLHNLPQAHTNVLSFLMINSCISAYSWTRLLSGSFSPPLNVVTTSILSPIL